MPFPNLEGHFSSASVGIEIPAKKGAPAVYTHFNGVAAAKPSLSADPAAEPITPGLG